MAAYLDGYSREYGLPPAHSGNRSYGYFPPPPDAQDAALWVGTGPPDPLRPYFANVRQIAGLGTDDAVWLCTGRREPWTAIWPRLRTLTVG